MTTVPNATFDSRARNLLQSLADSRQLKQFCNLTGPLGPTAEVEG
jgi:hypothetical protein